MNITDHPEELLAEYVDGTLDERVRPAVELHLAACETCRAEVDLARAAADVLARVADEPVPLGVTGPVLSEAEREQPRAERPRGQRIQWLVGAAAAAALIAVVAITVPDLGGSAGDGSAGGGDAAGLEAAEDQRTTQAAQEYPPVALEEQDVDYDDEALAELATDVAGRAEAGEQIASPADPASTDTRSALRCVEQGAGVAEQDVLVRLIRARYRSEPAYIAVYLEGPGIGSPARSVVIWVVSAGDPCEFREITSQRI